MFNIPLIGLKNHKKNGIYPKALYVDGINDKAIINSSVANTFYPQNTSVFMWINIKTYGVNKFIGMRNDSSYFLSFGGSQKNLYLAITNDGINWGVKSFTGASNIDLNSWLLLSYNYSGGKYRIFINGLLFKSEWDFGVTGICSPYIFGYNGTSCCEILVKNVFVLSNDVCTDTPNSLQSTILLMGRDADYSTMDNLVNYFPLINESEVTLSNGASIVKI